MQRATILHCFTPARNLSPFDVNMAIDAGWQHCMAYTGVDTGDIPALTQDAIFSRGPKGVKRTGIFIGGRDIHVAMEMIGQAEKAMVPPFEVSVLADPSGAFTTAAAMVACAERAYRRVTSESLRDKRVLVFGGTGPVGLACAMLASGAGADTMVVSHESLDKAEQAAVLCRDRYGSGVAGADGSSDAAIRDLLGDADVVFSAAKAGVQVLTASHLASAARVRVLCDVNAVPPQGIAGVGVTDDEAPIAASPAGAVGIGALAVGNVKYRTQQTLLQRMIDSEGPLYLHFEQALEVARGLA